MTPSDTVTPLPEPFDDVSHWRLFAIVPYTKVPCDAGVNSDTIDVPKGPVAFEFVPPPPEPRDFLPSDVNPDMDILMHMSINWPSNGEYFVPAYQVSSLPYLSSSTISLGQVHRYVFPFVTKFINVVNRGSSGTDKICLAFTERGLLPSVGNYVTLDQGDTVGHEVRTTEMYISCSAGTTVDYQIFCGLTTIPSKNFMILTGSNGHPGVG